MKTLRILITLLLPLGMVAQTITIGTGAEINIVGDNNGNTQLRCDGSIVLENTSILDLDNDALLSLGGDFITSTSGGNIQVANSTVEMRGTVAQQIKRGTGSSTNFSFYNLRIDNPGGVSIIPASIGAITINNVLEPNNGLFATADKLRIRALSANNYARVAAGGGTISGNVFVQKAFTGAVDDVLGWRQFSRPVSGPTNAANWNGISFLFAGSLPANRINTFRYNSAASGIDDYAFGWQAAAATSPETEALNIYLENNGFHNFSPSVSVTGVLNQGDFLNALNFTRDTADDPVTNDDAKGWNFIPNPWAALVQPKDLLSDAVNFTSGYKALHVWDASSGSPEVGQYRAILLNGVQTSKINYGTTGSDLDTAQYIPPFQAFWVKATANGQVCNLRAATMQSTVIKGQNFMKQQYPIIRLDVVDRDSATDQVVVYFDESLSREFDFVGDAYYLPSMHKEAPRFYAIEGNSKASIVGRPVDVTDSVNVVFGSPKNQSKFYIHADLDELEEGWFVYLRDKKDNKTYALAHNKSLAFSHYEGLASERFVVYYTKQANAFAHLVTGEDARVLPFVRNNQLVLQSFGLSGVAQINAFDAIGRLVYSENTTLGLGEERVLEIAASGKLLFIQVSVNGKTFVEKVYF
jgi:hypothetical protein